MKHLRQSHFPSIYTKLEQRKYNEFHKINDNAYVLQLPKNQIISHAFNVIDLFEYHLDDEELYQPNLKMGSFPIDGD